MASRAFFSIAVLKLKSFTPRFLCEQFQYALMCGQEERQEPYFLYLLALRPLASTIAYSISLAGR